MFSSPQSARAFTKAVGISVFVHVLFAWLLGQFGAPSAATAQLGPVAPGDIGASRTGRFGSEESNLMGTKRRRSTGPVPGLAEHQANRLATVLRGERPTSTESEQRDVESEPTRRRPDADSTSPRDSENPASDAPPERGSEEAEDAPDARSSDGAAARSAAAATFPSVEGDGAGGEGDGHGSRGGISLALIEEVIRSHHDEILECFAERHDYLSVGRKIVTTEFWLGTDGYTQRVRTVRRTTNEAVAECVSDRIAEWKFPELDAPVRFGKTFVFNSEIKAKWVRPRMRVPPE